MNGNSFGSRPAVSVIIVAYHGDRWMPDCIASLVKATQVSCHIVVVDNVGNTVLDKLTYGNHTHTVLHCPHPMGFAEANNFAMVNGGLETDFVCFLNQDTLSHDGWLDACVRTLRKNPRIGALTPPIATYDGQGWDPSFLECARAAKGLCERLKAGDTLGPWYEVPVIPAAAMVARTEAIRQVGPFDPIFGSYYEDYDLCRRIRKARYLVGISGGTRLCHFSGSATTTAQAERRRRRLILRNRTIYQVRHEGTSRWGTMGRYILGDFGWNLCRSLARTSSSMPLRDFLGAHWDLRSCAGRLLSSAHDESCWRDYTAHIGWPGMGATGKPILSEVAKEKS